jgi:hypothetical protein
MGHRRDLPYEKPALAPCEGSTKAAAIMVGEVAADLLRGRKLPAEAPAWEA